MSTEHSNQSERVHAEGDAALKANGAAASSRRRLEADEAVNLSDFVNNGNPWFVTLAQSDKKFPSPFQPGASFNVIPTDSSGIDATIRFSPTSALSAKFDPSTELLDYQDGLGIEGQITFFRGGTPIRSALSGVSLLGDPEPVAIWAADENGG